jgi:hypothetical protein
MTAETSIIDEKVQTEVDTMIYGPEYEFHILEEKVLVTVQMSLYKSQAKKKSRAKALRKLQGHQVAVKIGAVLTEKGEAEDSEFLNNFISFSDIELFTEQLPKSRKTFFRLEIGEEPTVTTFSNVGIKEDEDQMLLFIGIHLESAYNRVCKDYAGLVNHGKFKNSLT